MGTLMNVGGAVTGVATPLALREFADVDDAGDRREFIDQLGSYSTPSALTGIGTGLAGLGLYAADHFDVTNAVGPDAAEAALTYGVTSTSVGLYSGLRPAGAEPAGFRSRTVQRSRVNGEQTQGSPDSGGPSPSAGANIPG